MYPTQKDNGQNGISVMDAGIFPLLLGLGLSAASNALRKRGERGAADAANANELKKQQNEFLVQNPNFAENATFQRRKLGFLPESFEETFVPGGKAGPGGGDPSRSLGRHINVEKLLQSIASGGGSNFGETLRGTQLSDIQRPDFTPTKTPGSFLGDLAIGGLSGLGGAVASGAVSNPFGNQGPKPGDPDFVNIG